MSKWLIIVQAEAHPDATEAEKEDWVLKAKRESFGTSFKSRDTLVIP